tara:strand:+ start:335 stop:535 length:201 start_codon:yes stop_codon:yes gene_type:complete
MSRDNKQYKVFITQHYKPIIIQANSEKEAEYEVRNNYVWGEPSKCMIKTYEDNGRTGIINVPTKPL